MCDKSLTGLKAGSDLIKLSSTEVEEPADENELKMSGSALVNNIDVRNMDYADYAVRAPLQSQGGARLTKNVIIGENWNLGTPPFGVDPYSLIVEDGETRLKKKLKLDEGADIAGTATVTGTLDLTGTLNATVVNAGTATITGTLSGDTVNGVSQLCYRSGQTPMLCLNLQGAEIEYFVTALDQVTPHPALFRASNYRFGGEGNVEISSTENATDQITGALRVVGGIGLQGDIHANKLVLDGNDTQALLIRKDGGGATVLEVNASTSTVTCPSQLLITNTTAATNQGEGALQVSGGLGVTGDIHGDTLTVYDSDLQALLVDKPGVGGGPVFNVDTINDRTTVQNHGTGLTDFASLEVLNDFTDGLTLSTTGSGYATFPGDSFINSTNDLRIGTDANDDVIIDALNGDVRIENYVNSFVSGQRLGKIALGPTSVTLTAQQLVENTIWCNMSASQTITFPQDSDFAALGLPDPFYFERTWLNEANGVTLSRGSGDESFVYGTSKDNATYPFAAGELIKIAVHYITADISPRKVIYYIHQTN